MSHPAFDLYLHCRCPLFRMLGIIDLTPNEVFTDIPLADVNMYFTQPRIISSGHAALTDFKLSELLKDSNFNFRYVWLCD